MNTWSKKIAVGAAMLATLAITPMTFAQSVPTTQATVTATTAASARTYSGSWYLKVTAVNGTSISGVNGNDTAYTVDASSSNFVLRYGGKSDISEVTVGDMIWVRGKHAKGSTSLTAQLIRDMTVMKKGVVSGTVQSVSSTGFVLSNFGSTTYTVTVSSSTQYRLNGVKSLSGVQFTGLSNIMVGDRVRVSGIRDTANMTDAADAIRLMSRASATPVTTATQQ